jgi:hypothetical protein
MSKYFEPNMKLTTHEFNCSLFILILLPGGGLFRFVKNVQLIKR